MSNNFAAEPGPASTTPADPNHHSSENVSPANPTENPYADEQAHLDRLYGRIDALRSTAQRRRGENLLEQINPDDPQGASERDSYHQRFSEDLAKYDAAEHNLYFGRIDVAGEDESRRIGRIGLLDDDVDLTSLLLDWRAPLARPFYLATPAQPEGVTARRHVRTRNRRIRSVTVEKFGDGETIPGTAADGTDAENVASESALVAALSAARTGQMNDIVETIQREQDSIIRSEHRSVMVVQGGPGTGKTAVALHRAAYLLYTYRQTLERSGVLIVGPNEQFLTYIEQVLPSLGETGVLLSTIGNLYPGVRESRDDSPEAAALKGSLDIVEVMRELVRDWQSMPHEPVELFFDGYPLRLTAKIINRARGRARSSRRPHNAARDIFIESAVAGLAQQHADVIGKSLTDSENLLSANDVADIRSEMAEDEDLVAAISEFWPSLRPTDVLSDLWHNPDRLARVAPEWGPQDRAAVLLEPGVGGFSAGDAPLLDELAELIGDDAEDQRRELKARNQRLADAQDALDIMTGSAPTDFDDGLDPEILMAYDIIDAEQLAERQTTRVELSTVDRARADRQWAFGHVIVDEAQELSPMAWRMLFRRSPNRWMTVVGDTAQTSSPAGTESWSTVLEPYTAQRWKLAELTVNYRTPAEIMAVAARVLADIDPEQVPPTSIRSNGIEPIAVEVFGRDDLPAAVKQVIADNAEADAGRLTAVLAPGALTADLAAVADASVQVHSIAQIKGLEFDHVIVVNPAEIVRYPVGHPAHRAGLADLYVALTRATQRLTVVHSDPLPASLRGLAGPA